jgi:hypothetical protein
MGYEVNCTTSYGQTGFSVQCENNQVAPCGVILCPQDGSIDTEANALLLATWKTKIKTAEPNRWHPLQVCDNITPEDSENVMKERPFLGGKFIAWGKLGFTMEFDSPIYQSKQLANLNGRKWAAYTYDDNGNIEGISTDGIKFEPIKLLSLQVLPPKTPEAAANRTTTIKFIFADTELYMKKRVIINPTTWSPANDLEGVNNVDLATVGNWSASGGTVRVTYSGTDVPVVGLLAADFAITGKTISSIAPSGDGGTYAITSSGLVTSAINLVATAAITGVTAYIIESTGAASFTVS